jgi:hypothetical protein
MPPLWRSLSGFSRVLSPDFVPRPNGSAHLCGPIAAPQRTWRGFRIATFSRERDAAENFPRSSVRLIL